MTKEDKILSWKEFKTQADKINTLYNRTWLKTEYHQTVANAKAAADFKQYQAEANLYPNLQFVAVTDSRTREKHLALNGYTAPVNDPVWNKILPPLDWGCRCAVIQTNDPISTTPPPTNFIKEAFQNNPASSGEIFPRGAMYASIIPPQLIEITVKFGERMFAKITAQVVKSENKNIAAYARKALYSLSREAQFETVFKANKGKVLQHYLINQKAGDYKEVLEVAKAFAKQGKIAELMPEMTQVYTLKYRQKIYLGYPQNLLTNPDLRVDGIYMDVKRPQSISKIVYNANKASISQQSIVIIHCGRIKNITWQEIKNKADRILDKEKNSFYSGNSLYFFFRDNLVKFSK